MKIIQRSFNMIIFPLSMTEMYFLQKEMYKSMFPIYPTTQEVQSTDKIQRLGEYITMLNQ